MVSDDRGHAGPAEDPSPATSEIASLGVAELRRRFDAREMTSVELLTLLLERIEAIDRKGPSLHAVLAVSDDALDVAAQLDAERSAGRVRGPLHGIPVLVKDNIDTATGAPTTAGSLALATTRPGADAWVVRQLRSAGAIVLGKTNLSEWANFRSRHSSSGWSGCGGQTRNPYVLDRSPSGSSSGSGVAVAAGLAPLALGTETDGSILSPSAVSGLVGIKPTVGRVSRTGVVPVSATQDTVGPMARSVADAAELLAVISGPDPADPATRARRAGRLEKVGTLGPSGLRGVRLGVARSEFFWQSARAEALVEEALAVMAAAGAIMVDPANLPASAALRQSGDEMTVMLTEFKVGVEAYLRTRHAPGADVPRSLAELIEFNTSHSAEELHWFGQDLFIDAERTSGLDGPLYRKARARGLRRSRAQGIDAALSEHGVTALVAPTTSPAWCIDLVNGDSRMAGSGYKAAAIAGYPAITLPIGLVSGLPIGISLIGRAWDERHLIEVAAGIEAALKVAVRPAFLPAAEA
jgi:amidase